MRSSISFLILISTISLLGCKKSAEHFIPLTNPLDSCKAVIHNSNPAIYDSINDLSFRLSQEWKINFNHSLKITVCVDTIASDRYGKVRTFTVNTVSSDLNLPDFFSKEVKIMHQDSVDILYLGKYIIDDKEALYAIAKTQSEGLAINNVFFYIKTENKIIIVQAGVSESSHPVQEICSTMPFINSISFKVYPKSEVALVYSQ